MPNYLSIVKKWLSLGRGIPLATILASVLIVVLSFSDVINLELSPGENILIVLLALIAFDTLRERINFLEKLDKKISDLSQSGTRLTARRESPIESMVEGATEFIMLAGTGMGLIDRHRAQFKEMIEAGNKIRIILINPASQKLYSYDLTDILSSQEVISKVNVSLNYCKSLVLHGQNKGNIEVRLIEAPMAFSLIGVNPSKANGAINIEYRGYKVDYFDRPSLFLAAENDFYWFDFYRDQFEKIWVSAQVWKP